MTAPIVAELTATVSETVGVIKSATALIQGFKQKLADAIAAAIANGATEAELQPLVSLETDLEVGEKELAQAVADNP